MLVHLEGAGRIVEVSGKAVGRGGEAEVLPVRGAPGEAPVVAKLFREPTADRAAKVAAMIARPPLVLRSRREFDSVAWPLDRVMSADAGRRFLGYVMPWVRGAAPLCEVYTPRARRRLGLPDRFDFLLRIAADLAAAVHAAHAAGYVVGDLREANVLVVGEAVVLVDADSFQVRDGDVVYRCPVGTSDYTPPELQGQNFAAVDRTPEHDAFALAVLMHQVLMLGTHPYDGRYTGQGDPAPIGARIAAGHWPRAPRFAGRPAPYEPSPHAPPPEALPPRVWALMGRCFGEGQTRPGRRPTAREWSDMLREAADQLTPCRARVNHVYAAALPECPWCRFAAQTGHDPFPGPAQLPPAPKRRLWPGPALAGAAALLLTLGVGGLVWRGGEAPGKSVTPLVEAPPPVVADHAGEGDAALRASDFARAAGCYGRAIEQAPGDASLYFRRGEARRRGGDDAGAVADYDEATRRNGSDAAPFRERGAISLRWGRCGPALQDLNRAITRAPSDAAALALRASLRRERGEDGDALADCASALGIDRRNAVAHRERGTLLARRGEYDGAAAEWVEALRLDPADALVYVHRGLARQGRGDESAARADLGRGLELLGKATPRARADRAEALLGLRSFDHALVECAEALRLNPEYARAHRLRGCAWLAKLDAAAALAAADEAVKHDGDDATNRLFRARVRLLRGDQAGALEDVNAAAALGPADVRVREARALYHTTRGEAGQALPLLEEVARRTKQAPAWAALAHCRRALKDYDGAIRDYGEALGCNPAAADCRLGRAECRLEAGDLPAALDDFRAASAADGVKADAYFGAGRVLFRQGAYEAAVAEFGRAVGADGQHAGAYRERGRAHVRLGKEAEAADDFRAALRLAPADAATHLALAGVHVRQGKRATAAEEVEAAFRLGDDSAEAHFLRGEVERSRDMKAALASYREAFRRDADYTVNTFAATSGFRTGAEADAAIALLTAPKGKTDLAPISRAADLPTRESPSAAAPRREAPLAGAFDDFLLAEAYLSRKDEDRALAALHRARDAGLKAAGMHLDLGSISLKKKEVARAVEEYGEAIRAAGGEYARGYSGRATAYWRQKDYEAALKDLDEAIRQDPTVKNIYAMRGTVRLRLKQDEGAVADLTTHLAHTPDDAFALGDRASVYCRLAQYDAALADCDALVALPSGKSENESVAHNVRGNVLISQGNIDKAIDEYSASLKLRRDAVVLANRGGAYRRKRSTGLALNDCNEALKVDPECAWAYLVRSWVHKDLNNEAQREADYEKAVRLDPSFAK